MTDADLTERLVAVIERDILPLTGQGVARGNKVFGAAILRKADLSLVLAETNNETENPLWHGEIHTLKRFYELSDHPATSELIFLTTHEPCTMCMSAITWAGFDNYYYLFSHEDSRDAFAIPHDLRIMQELYGLPPGGYRRDNAFWQARDIGRMAEALPPGPRDGLLARIAAIRARYGDLSAAYQAGKGGNAIPLN